MIQRSVTSWVLNEHDRLRRLSAESQGRALARDLADLLAGYLNQENEVTLRLTCEPDVLVRDQKAADFLYEGSPPGLQAAFEVTRPLVGPTQSEIVQRDRFLSEIASNLPVAFAGGYAFYFGPDWRPPADQSKRAEMSRGVASILDNVSRQLPPVATDLPSPIRIAELVTVSYSPPADWKSHWLAAQVIDLSGILPGIAVRYDENAQPPQLICLGRRGPWYRSSTGGDKEQQGSPAFDHKAYLQWYRGVLSEADSKLTPYQESGAETFLLFDCRLGDHFLPVSLDDLKEWHDEAERDSQDGLGLSRIAFGDFSHISHILSFDIHEMGVGVQKIWRVPAPRL